MSIFVQIASYRDPQLIPTIKSALDNAKYPDDLIFAIARQYSDEDGFDDLSEYEDDPRFKIVNIPHTETQGVCWARRVVQELYDGEDHTLQIDSHMRFNKHWDETLINMLEGLRDEGFLKPVLTAYAPSFDPDDDPSGRKNEAWRMVFDKFTPEGVVFFLPEVIPGWKEMIKPVRSRFYSAHFAFSIGQFALEVRHDPEFYFHGEEISIAARAFTHGYDLFHPHIPIIWHEYTRKGRTKHWDDDPEWSVLNRESLRRNRVLFGMEKGDIDFGEYGFGKLRTLRDYEIYSGINFARRGVQQYTLDKEYPPNPYDEKEWEGSFATIFKYEIQIPKENFDGNDYDFFAIAFHRKNGTTIVRKDAQRPEIMNALKTKDNFVRFNREFNTKEIPDHWVVWMHGPNGWGKRLSGKI